MADEDELMRDIPGEEVERVPPPNIDDPVPESFPTIWADLHVLKLELGGNKRGFCNSSKE